MILQAIAYYVIQSFLPPIIRYHRKPANNDQTDDYIRQIHNHVTGLTPSRSDVVIRIPIADPTHAWILPTPCRPSVRLCTRICTHTHICGWTKTAVGHNEHVTVRSLMAGAVHYSTGMPVFQVDVVVGTPGRWLCGGCQTLRSSCRQGCCRGLRLECTPVGGRCG